MAEKRPLTYDDFWSFKIVSDAQLAPDGRRVAYVVSTLDRDTDQQRSSVWVADLESGEAQQFTSGTKRDFQPRWSPDGNWLAFVSTRGDGKTAQIYVMPSHGGEGTRLTDRPEGAQDPAWSPDSSRLAFTVYLESERQKLPAETAWMEEKKDERKEKPQIRRLVEIKYRFDGRGYLDRHAHLFVASREGGEARQLTDGEWDDLEPTWSPDGTAIAFMSNRTPDRDYNFASDVWLVDPESGETRRLTDGTLTAVSPSWSPDGETIAFYAEPEWIKNGTQNTHVWTVSRQGGDQRDIVPQLDQTRAALIGDHGMLYPAPPVWSPDGDTIYFTVSERGSEVLYRVPAAGGAPNRVSQGEHDITIAHVTPDGSTLVCVAATPTQPYEIWRLPTSGGPLQPVTDTNRELLEQVEIAQPERFTYSSIDGWEMEGWLVRPRHGVGEQAPMVLHVHGGPHGMFGNTFYFNMQVLAGAGIASLFINPRGSAGYGLDFMRAADWGDKDYQDLMNGVDHVIGQGGIDGKRLAITGNSYGGFMTCWTVGHTGRFACAAASNPVTNLISFYGTSDIGALWFEQQMGGPFWENWERYHLHSPLSYVANVSTPLLLIHSENDYRCPIEQSEQMFVALKMRRCEVEMVRVPQASHSLASAPFARHRIEHWQLRKGWYEKYFGREG